MRQILYNSSAQTVRFEFPPEWEYDDITDVTLTIKDKDGDTLMAPASITLMTDTTLNVAAARFADTVYLDTGADTVYPGDKLVIDGIEGTETVTVRGYDASTRAVQLEGILRYAHATGDNVYGLFGTYTLDTSTVSTFTKGLEMTFVWTPDGYQSVITEEAQIAASVMDISGLERSFALVYPRAYEAFTNETNRFNDMAQEAERQLKMRLLSRRLDYDRIVDQDMVKDVLMSTMAWLWVLQGDEQHEDEREVMARELDKHFEYLCQLPIWVDDDQDLIEDDNETTPHKHTFYSGW